MATHHEEKPRAAATHAKAGEPEIVNPRATDHPTGSKQAAENAANDPPS